VELSLITNDVSMARAADNAGIDRVLVDLERLGKAERQRGRALFLSSHVMDDVERIRNAVSRARLMVRIDPPHAGTAEQVGKVIAMGAQYVMLPWFERLRDASGFVRVVGKRARPVLLVENTGALEILPDLCVLPGVAEMHVGLNDLAVSFQRGSWFNMLLHPAVDAACATFREFGMPFGLGGIGSLSRTDLPINPESVLAEQVSQGATRGWLGRSFRDAGVANIPREVDKLRQAIAKWEASGAKQRAAARARLAAAIALSAANQTAAASS